MRFPEDKIKEAILHPDLEIRDRATDYFAKSYSHDVSIMAQVMKAVETYGRQDAYRLIGLSRAARSSRNAAVGVSFDPARFDLDAMNKRTASIRLGVSHGSQPSLPQRSLSLWKREEV